MMLDEFLTDAALAVVIAVMLFGLAYWLYLTATHHRASHLFADEELDELAEETLDRLDARCEYEVAAPDPLCLQYRLESADGKVVRSGSVTFQQFTFADWYRTGVHKVIRAAIEAENPGWEIVGYHLLPDNGEEVTL